MADAISDPWNLWNKILISASQSEGQVDFASARQAHNDGSGEEPVLEAVLFKSLYSGRPAPGVSAIQPRCPCWRIKGASFSGLLDLNDSCHISGGCLPSLEFEDCSFPAGFRADDAVIKRLSFSNCVFGTFPGIYGHPVSISLHNTQLEGDLTLSGLKSLRNDKLLGLYAYGLNVAGSLRLSETVLAAPHDERRRGDERPHYAFDLYGAEIRNDLQLAPRVAVRGGLRIRTARIGGDLAFGDLQVSDGFDGSDGDEAEQKRREEFSRTGLSSRLAIDATSSHIKGNIFFDSYQGLKRFRAVGKVDFYGFETSGSVVLSGASFQGSDYGNALRLSAGRIDGNLLSLPVGSPRPSKLTIDGDATISGISVKGQVYLVGTFTSLDASGIKVLGDMTLAVQVRSSLNLGGTDIKGQLDLSGFSFPRADNVEGPTKYSFSMKDADIGHTLYLASPSTTPLRFESCRRTRLRCYPQHQLFQIRVDQGMASILHRPGGEPLLLDGVSSYLHRLSQSGALDLSTREAVQDYVRFFGAYVWAEDGPFVLVESISHLPEGSLTEKDKEPLKSIREIEVDADFSELELQIFRNDIEDDLKKKFSEDDWSAFKGQLAHQAVRARAHVRYGAVLFRATFMILKAAIVIRSNEPLQAGGHRRESFGFHGRISIVDDEWIADLDPEKLPIYDDRPLIREGQSDYNTDLPWDDPFPLTELAAQIPAWRDLLERRLARFQNAAVDLTNASCRTLEDGDGRAWGSDISLYPENFTYDGVGTPLNAERRRAAIADRKGWLSRIPRDKFMPQPYAQLAKVLNASGDSDGAKEIEEQKITLEKTARFKEDRGKGIFQFAAGALSRSLWVLFHITFRYGLSPQRASATVLACLLIGWAGVTVMNNTGYLVQNTSTVATLVATDRSTGGLTAAFPDAKANYEATDLPCGAAINGLLYATDVFIPLLDLRQEGRCDVRSQGAKDINPEKEWNAQKGRWNKLAHYLWAIFHAPVFWWQFAKSAYAILGWGVVSLALLTYSGTLRRWGEN